MDTEALVKRLAAEAAPVRRVMAPWKRAVLWMALSIPPMAIVVGLHGLNVDPAMFLADGRLLTEQVATLATAITAAIAAFMSTIPGRGRARLWAPVIPLAVWLATVGKGCLDDLSRLGTEALDLRSDSDCLVPMVLISLVPGAAMLAMLRRGAPLAPRATLALGALATAAVVAFGLRLFHIGDISFMILAWHFGVIAMLSLVSAALGPAVLRWPGPAVA